VFYVPLHSGVWGYHPLAVTLRNTGEVLRVVNRPGNRPSHEGAAARLDESIALCRAAGFRRIRLFGDTDFSQTERLDSWHEQDVLFTFGLDVSVDRFIDADDALRDDRRGTVDEKAGRGRGATAV
jgi:hypothetical protein